MSPHSREGSTPSRRTAAPAARAVRLCGRGTRSRPPVHPQSRAVPSTWARAASCMPSPPHAVVSLARLGRLQTRARQPRERIGSAIPRWQTVASMSSRPTSSSPSQATAAEGCAPLWTAAGHFSDPLVAGGLLYAGSIGRISAFRADCGTDRGCLCASVEHHGRCVLGARQGDTEACLSGQTFPGLRIEGCDKIRTL